MAQTNTFPAAAKLMRITLMTYSIVQIQDTEYEKQNTECRIQNTETPVH